MILMYTLQNTTPVWECWKFDGRDSSCEVAACFYKCSLCVPQAQLYLLVTDQGFLTEEKVVWESLHNVDGDGNFCDSEFRLRPPSDPETVYRGQQDQIDQVRTSTFPGVLSVMQS